ncbi:MAG: fumarylacetoacetate hydrolase family protein [Chloroflexi bacterium]|nr:fumarylacetoacetate hydrolase family protein [Anaerolineaceae bacterium]NMB88856.1 fumarylacetoacetate hydrolase family protein [Chloroflexota bacterium]
MRFIRYQLGSEQPRYGWIYEDYVGPIDGSLLGEYRRMEAEIPLERVKLLAPVVPGKIVCVGRNYREHAREQNAEVPEIPLLFLKPPSSVIGPDETILLPPQSQQVEHEGELAVVMGRQGSWIPIEEAMQYVLGFTVGNDVTARDLQRRDGQWTRSKGFDTFCPLGPWIETDVDIADVLITCRVNDELRQMASTREMVFTVPQLISFVSSVMTLQPGDVILTGTPAGIGPLLEGDQVEVNIEGIGTLRNPVRLQPGRPR